MKKIQSIIIACLLLQIGLFAQQTPAPEQSGAVLIMGATAHLGNGKVIPNAAIGFENGKLTLVADANTVRIDPAKYPTQIDAQGKHVYPGFIAPNTTLGLIEIEAVRATNDMREVGSFNPNLRSIIAYNTDSNITPTVRSNGVLMAQVVPQGGRVSGQSTIVQLDAWNWEDAAYATDEGIHLNWPRSFNWWNNEANKDYPDQVEEIKTNFKEAQAYAKNKKVTKPNLKMEAMKGLFDKSKTLYVHTGNVKSITEAVLFFKDFGVNLVIVGGTDTWMITDLLKDHKVSVILGDTHSLPSRSDSDIDESFKTAKVLKEAGVLYAFGMNGAWQQRNLAFQAGQAVGYGLDYEDAVTALTLNTAKILGIDKTVGSLEEGKDATLFISEGDALDMRTCKLTQAFIGGRKIDLDNKQKALYRKFQEKYRGK